MGNALWAGISGLNASSKQMDVIANNIANVNTIGYKAGKIYFADVLSQSISGGASGSMQVGRGVTVTDVTTQFGSGSFETTDNATDVSIDGDGFFMVNDQDGATYYTRAGSFTLDKDGYMVDTNGYYLQGYNFYGSTVNTISNISLKDVQSTPQVTSIFSVGVNLNAETADGGTYTTSQSVYDSLGAQHSLGITFQKTGGTGTGVSGYWGFTAGLDGTSAVDQSYSGFKFDADGNLVSVYRADAAIGASTVGNSVLTIDNEGQLYQSTTTPIELTYDATTESWSITNADVYTDATVAGDAGSVSIDLDGSGGPDITLTPDTGITWASGTVTFSINQAEADPTDLSITLATLDNGATIGDANVITWDLAGSTALSITNYASSSVIKSLSNDGYASGLLKSLSIESDGTITGFFTNGQTASLARIVLADFNDATGLRRMGSNLFAETVTSGPAIKNIPGDSGMGELTSNSLEMSNTDIATEFINMITAQKAYQASSRVITTQDELLSELMNIMR
jgi:flagellar hook protein FlgE